MPDGIWSALWNAEEYNECLLDTVGRQSDLRDRFLPYEKLTPVVRAMLVRHANHMVGSLLRDVRLMDI